MSQVNFSSTSSVSFGELGPTTSLQLMFAKLQLELAQTAKTQAMDKMDAIASAQDEQKLVSQLLNEARQAQADGNSGTGVGKTSINGVTVTGKDCYPMSQEMVDYMDAHKLAYPNGDGDYILGKDEWD
ncbi:USH1C-binding protein 1, partial [Desulfovibrio sp.]